MRTYKIHLIRHGATSGNEQGQYIGRTDLPLTTNGIKELEKIKSGFLFQNYGLVFSSPLKRALQTADILLNSANPRIIENFNEMDFGEFEGKTMLELSDNADYQDWIYGRNDRPKGGEGFKDFASRLAAGLRECVQIMMNENRYLSAAVMPGGAIMTLLTVCAVPRRKALNDWACDAGHGFEILVNPTIYASSGIVEVTGEVPIPQSK